MGPLVPVSTRENLTVSTTIVTLTVPAGASRAFMSLTDGSGTIRFTFDGTDPTTTAGHQMQPGDILDLTSPERTYVEVLQKLEFLREDATDGTLQVDYFA